MYRARSSRNRKNCGVLFEYQNGTEFIVFDTETTGLDPERDYIIELAAKKYTVIDRKMELTETMDLFMRPPFEMDQKVIEIHNITNKMLEKYPPEKSCIQEIERFFGDKPIVVGKHVEYDVSMMRAMYRRCGLSFTPYVALDIEEMARDLIVRSETGDYQLHTLAKAYGVDDGLTFHNALDDVEATARLLYCFYLEYKSQPQTEEKKQKIYVNAIYFWKGNNSSQQGIWLKTNLDEQGHIFFSTLNKAWYSSKINLENYDIDDLEAYCLRKTGLSFSEFGRLTEKKFKELRQLRKKEGIYL